MKWYPAIAEHPKVAKWMFIEVKLYPARYDTFNCGEVNCTLLAENAAQEFDLYEGNDIPEWLFEVSAEVDRILERQKTYAEARKELEQEMLNW
jgi:hypothetical protein